MLHRTKPRMEQGGRGGPEQVHPCSSQTGSVASKSRIVRAAFRADLMPPFHYRCPNTGFHVQGYSPEQTSDDASTFEPITCLACAQVHWVSAATGKVLGAPDE